MKWLNLRHKGMFDFRVEFYRFYLLHDKRDNRHKAMICRDKTGGNGRWVCITKCTIIKEF